MSRLPSISAARRSLLIANGHNPAAVRVTISRPPTASEVRFGHGCRHYSTATLPAGRRFVTIDGARWTVEPHN